jgi:folate-binding protein YgfZ
VGESLIAAGWRAVGLDAYEQVRVAAWEPSQAHEVDHKSIPHELDLLRDAVHLAKGCYKGQETVARVHNLGHPPRRLVFLDLDGMEHTVPAAGSDVMADGRKVGTVTSSVLHYEAGPVALAVIRRAVDPALQLSVVDGDTTYAASQTVIVAPDAGSVVGRPQGIKRL